MLYGVGQTTASWNKWLKCSQCAQETGPGGLGYEDRGGERHLRPGFDLCKPSNMRVSPGLSCIYFPTVPSTGRWSEASLLAPQAHLMERWGCTGCGCHGGYSPGDTGVSAVLSSRGVSLPSSG